MSNDRFTEARMQRCAQAMRDAFFAEFGRPETLTPEEAFPCFHMFICITLGELLEGLARIKKPEIPLDKALLDMAHSFVATNQDRFAEIAEGRGDGNDVLGFLKSGPFADMDEAAAKDACAEHAAARDRAQLARDAGDAATYAAMPVQERANVLVTAYHEIAEVESEAVVTTAAAQQIMAGAIVSVLAATERHKRAEVERAVIKGLARIVAAGLAEADRRHDSGGSVVR